MSNIEWAGKTWSRTRHQLSMDNFFFLGFTFISNAVRLVMFFLMTTFTQGYAIAYFMPQFWVFRKLFDVVSIQIPSSRIPTMLTGVNATAMCVAHGKEISVVLNSNGQARSKAL